MSVSTSGAAGTQAVGRAITLLKSFTDSRPEWHPSDLAEANGLNLSTTYRILGALESEGLVVRRADNRRYRLGPELIALGGSALRSNSLRAVARPIIQQLAETTGESATLEVLAGTQVIVIVETGGQHVVAMSQDVGARLPAHATSTGKAILAFAADDVRAESLSQPLEAITDRTIVDIGELEKQFAEIRERGYAVASGELELDFVAIASPVRNFEGDVIASLSVGGPGGRFTPLRVEQIAPEVRNAAQQVSAQLGYQPLRR